MDVNQNVESQIAETALRLVGLLREKNISITTAESCTGGLISSSIVDVPGASAVFEKGFVTYSNEAKMQMIGVKEETLAANGAVSPQTAYEMSEGAARAAKSFAAVSATGIAGPEGGTKDKPVGLVYIGCTVGEKTVTERHLFSGDRKYNRLSSVLAALKLAQKMIEQNETD